MSQVLPYLYAHSTAIGYVCAAFVTALPAVKSDFDWYKYFYDVTHALMPIVPRKTALPKE